MDWFTLFLLYCVLSPVVVSAFRGFVMFETVRLSFRTYRKAKKELNK